MSAPVATGKKVAASQAALATNKMSQVKRVAFEKPTNAQSTGPEEEGDLPGSSKILAYQIVG